MTDAPKPRTFVRMFKPEFAPLIRSDEKLLTIRSVPKVMPRRCDLIDPRMWEGKPYWSKQAKILEEPRVILVVEAIKLCHMHYFDGSGLAQFDVDALAKIDGFKSWAEMRQWFEREYKIDLEKTPFSGVVIMWARK